MSDPDGPEAAGRGADRIELAALCVIVGLRLTVSSTIHPPAGYALNAALAALLGLIIVRGPVSPHRYHRAIIAGVGLYFLAGALSVPLSTAPWFSLRWELLQLGDLLLFLAALFVPGPKKTWLAWTVVLAASLSAAWALRQHLGGFAETLKTPGLDAITRSQLVEGRVFGLTCSPDMLAAIVAGTLPIALALLARGFAGPAAGRGPLAVPPLVAALLLAPALFWTRSVGGALAVAAGMGIWLGLVFGLGRGRRTDWRRALAAAAVVTACVGLALVFMHGRGRKFYNLANPHNPIARRVDYWATGLELWLEFPAFGAGGGMHSVAALAHRQLRANEAKHAHNVLIETLAETGPLGLLGLALILGGFAATGARMIRGAEAGRLAGPAAGPLDRTGAAERWLDAGFFAGGAAVALHALIDFDWSVAEVSAGSWLALAFAAGRSGPAPAAALGPDKGGRDPSVAGWGRPIKAALLGALLLVALAELYEWEGARRREAAGAAAQAGDWAAVGRAAERALAWDRTNDEVWSLLGRSALAGGRMGEAQAAIRSAISINPRYPYHYRDLGFALIGQELEAACAAFAEAVARYPNGMALNQSLGRCLVRRGRLAEAEGVFLHAAQCQARNADALTDLSRLYGLMGKPELAADHARRAAAAKP